MEWMSNETTLCRSIQSIDQCIDIKEIVSLHFWLRNDRLKSEGFKVNRSIRPNNDVSYEILLKLDFAIYVTFATFIKNSPGVSTQRDVDDQTRRGRVTVVVGELAVCLKCTSRDHR